MDPLTVRDSDSPQAPVDRLRVERDELRASRTRLVLAADAARRRIERDLHDGPLQRLVALAVDLQRAQMCTDDDPAAAKALLDGMRRDVRDALDELVRLAHGIYPPLLEEGGLATALRTAAAGAGIRARIEVATVGGCPPAIASAVYFCCLEVLERAGDRAQISLEVREEDGALAFDIALDGARAGDADAVRLREPLSDRIEALGGRVTARAEDGKRMRVSGTLPLSR